MAGTALPAAAADERPPASAADRRETAGVTTNLIVRYVRANAGEPGVDALLARVGAAGSSQRFEDESRWHSYDDKIALFEAAAEVLGDPQAARRIGETVLDERVGALLRTLVQALGSPAAVLRHLAGTAAKFTTTATMRALHVGSDEALVEYRLHDGFRPSAADCDYNIGLLSQVPAIFGLPPATVTEQECQVQGAQRCLYALAWRARMRFGSHRLRRRATALAAQLDAVTGQLEALQSAAADLVSSGDMDQVLGRIAARAGSAVGAQRYLLAVQVRDDVEPRVHHDGFTDEEAARVVSSADGGRCATTATGRSGERPPQAAAIHESSAGEGPAGASSCIVARVASGRRDYGYLAAFHPGDQAFFGQEQRLLDSYARYAASALDAADSLAAARQERNTATVLLSLARSLASAATTAEVARELARLAPALADADDARVLLWDPAQEALVAVDESYGVLEGPDGSHGGRCATADFSEIDELLRCATPRLYDCSTTDPYLRRLLLDMGSTAMAVVPMLVQQEPLGVITVGWSRAGRAATGDQHLIERLVGLADQAATALHNAMLLERVQRQALHDPLTELPNRTLLTQRLEQALALRARGDDEVAVLFVDVDRFKQINDTLGHRAGDELLVTAGRRMRDALREVDTLARFAGDEFVAVCPGLNDTTEAAAIATRLRNAFASPFHLGGSEVAVTASVGVTVTVEGDASSSEELLRRADADMYGAKRRRRTAG